MISIYTHLDYLEFIGDIFTFPPNVKESPEWKKEYLNKLSECRRKFLDEIVDCGMKNPVQIFQTERRRELEKAYDSDEHYACRLKSGMILNLFEQDLDNCFSGAGRPNWNKLCSETHFWILELESKLNSKDFKNLPRIYEDESSFYNLLFELEECPMPGRLREAVRSYRDNLAKDTACLDHLVEEFSGHWDEIIKERLQ